MRADVFVIGGGPAGATAAHLLAAWGWSVVAAAPHATGRPSLAESLPPSTRKLLAFVGQLDAVERAQFHPNHGNLANWAEKQWHTTTSEGGFHVLRASFDRVLRGIARTSGAKLIDA